MNQQELIVEMSELAMEKKNLPTSIIDIELQGSGKKKTSKDSSSKLDAKADIN